MPTDPTPTLMTAREVCAALRIARSTLYATPYLRQRVVRVGRRGVRWERATVDSYITLQRASARAA